MASGLHYAFVLRKHADLGVSTTYQIAWLSQSSGLSGSVGWVLTEAWIRFVIPMRRNELFLRSGGGLGTKGHDLTPYQARAFGGGTVHTYFGFARRLSSRWRLLAESGATIMPGQLCDYSNGFDDGCTGWVWFNAQIGIERVF